MTATVDSLYRGFRENYLDYETLTAQLQAWAGAYPGFVHLQSLAGRSPSSSPRPNGRWNDA